MAISQAEAPRLVPVTYELAAKFRDMERFPRDRELKGYLKESIRQAVLNGEFRGSEWASAFCRDTGLEYRINGKHTSHVFCELFESGHVLECTQLIRRYICDTVEDASRLYATFDSPQSARTKQDIVKAFAVSCPALADLPIKELSLITAGLAYNHWELQAYIKKPVEQCSLLLQHADFAVWAAGILGERAKNSKHIHRRSVVAAMARTWLKCHAAANDFWPKVRDDCDDPSKSPIRWLYRWLVVHTIGAGNRIPGKQKSGDKEMFVRCLQAWNAWRKHGVDGGSDFRYYPNNPTPTAL